MRAIVAATLCVSMFGAACSAEAQSPATTAHPAPAAPAAPSASQPAPPAPASPATPTPPAAPASAQKVVLPGPLLAPLKVGNWIGGAYAAPGTTTFDYCMATAAYLNGVTVAFALTNTFKWYIALIDPGWNLTVGTNYPVALSVDRRASGVATATAIGTSEVLIQLNPTVALFKTFMEGEKLNVDTASRVYTFDLTNTVELLPDLLKCVEIYAGAAPPSSNPFVNTSN